MSATWSKRESESMLPKSLKKIYQLGICHILGSLVNQSETEISEQNTYQGVLLGSTLEEGSKGSKISEEREVGLCYRFREDLS